MRNKQILLILTVIIIYSGCNSRSAGGSNNKPGKVTVSHNISLTVGEKKDLNPLLGPEASGKTINWASSSNGVARVTGGIVEARGFLYGGTSTESSEAIGTAVISAKSTDGAFEAVFNISTSMEADADMMTLPPLKDQFADYFMIGNIVTSNDLNSGGTAVANTRLTRHFNVLTVENDMKPSAYGGYPDDLNFDLADDIVNPVLASGFKIHGHTLLWHQQIPRWQREMADSSKETALAAMKKFITNVMTKYKGKIYSWDVLNEAFPDSGGGANWKTAMRPENPWFKAIGSDFVYEAFKAVRLADPSAILYYNDYNLDQLGKSNLVRDMVRDINQQWKSDPRYDNRNLIDGIGMQSHHNTGVMASSIQASLDLFRPLGVKISISEIDVLSQSWSAHSGNNTPTNNGKLQAANLYGEYFSVFIKNSDIIERVTFWGVYDEQSWRKISLPLIFEGSSVSKAKPAYYKVVGSL